MNYSQNQEQEYILNYFGDYKGNLLSIGENDGKKFSNALRLIELGWSATLVEPSPKAFKALELLHKDNPNVRCINVAVSDTCGKMKFYESGHHLSDKSDFSLLSSLDYSETEKWRRSGVKFTETEVVVLDYRTLLLGNTALFDFISLDTEGNDLKILKQIDLSHTRLLCIEWNLNQALKAEIQDYAAEFGLYRDIYQSSENLIIGRG